MKKLRSEQIKAKYKCKKPDEKIFRLFYKRIPQITKVRGNTN